MGTPIVRKNHFIAGEKTSADKVKENFDDIKTAFNNMENFVSPAFTTDHFAGGSVTLDKITIDAIEKPGDIINRAYADGAGKQAVEIFQNSLDDNDDSRGIFGTLTNIKSDIVGGDSSALVFGTSEWEEGEWGSSTLANTNKVEQSQISGFLMLNSEFTRNHPYRVRVHAAASEAEVDASLTQDDGSHEDSRVIHHFKCEGDVEEVGGGLDINNNLNFNAIIPIKKDWFWCVHEQVYIDGAWQDVVEHEGDGAVSDFPQVERTSYIKFFAFIPITSGLLTS